MNWHPALRGAGGPPAIRLPYRPNLADSAAATMAAMQVVPQAARLPVRKGNHRVQQRVESGGHDIPAAAIARRYTRTVSNFLNVFIPLCDATFCYDNSAPIPILAFEQQDEERFVVDRERYETILRSIDE